jgi:uncharacterized membrane protein HdeD (DUF308 family)
MPVDLAVPVGLAERWWAVSLRGIAAIVFGILLLLYPGAGFATLVILFGIYAIVEGILNLVSAVTGRGRQPWWALTLEGVVSIAAGVVVFLWPAAAAVALVWTIAIWAIVTGVLEISAAIRLRRVVRGEWMLALAGILSIILGALLFASPAAGALAITVMIGIYAIVFGVLLLVLGLRLRRARRIISGPPGREVPAPA